jgi:hypothetical protein
VGGDIRDSVKIMLQIIMKNYFYLVDAMSFSLFCCGSEHRLGFWPASSIVLSVLIASFHFCCRFPASNIDSVAPFFYSVFSPERLESATRARTHFYQFGH